MCISSSQLHIDPHGAGVRLYITGTVSLNADYAKALNTIAPNVQTTFSTGLGVRFSIQDVNGHKKAFTSVNIGNTEYSYATCSADTDCQTGSTCVLGFCLKQQACRASQAANNLGPRHAIGVCPAGTSGSVTLGTCYQDCKSGYAVGFLGSASPNCYQNCPSDHSCGTEDLPGSKCFSGRVAGHCNALTSSINRDHYDRRVDAVCPGNSVNAATGCLSCPAGWSYATSANLGVSECKINNCPSDFPTLCVLNGAPNVCVRQGVSCSSYAKVGGEACMCSQHVHCKAASCAHFALLACKPGCLWLHASDGCVCVVCVACADRHRSLQSVQHHHQYSRIWQPSQDHTLMW